MYATKLTTEKKRIVREYREFTIVRRRVHRVEDKYAFFWKGVTPVWNAPTLREARKGVDLFYKSFCPIKDAS